MKQKFMLIKKDADSGLIIREFSELDKEAYTCVYEETYSADAIRDAIKNENVDSLMDEIRTDSFFPASFCMTKITAGLFELYASREAESIEILVDDMDIIHAYGYNGPPEKEKEPVEIDDLLDEETVGPFIDDDLIASISSKSDDEEEEKEEEKEE